MNKDGKKIETDVIDDNLNPIFMVAKDFSYDVNAKNTSPDPLKEAPPIILEVFDSDEGLISDSADFLGRAVINLKDANMT